MPTLHVQVPGRVQGVGFRWFGRQTARRLGISGWVRNNPDGSVEIAARGDETALEQLENTVAKGPPGAFVKAVVHLAPIAEDEVPEGFTNRG